MIKINCIICNKEIIHPKVGQLICEKKECFQLYNKIRVEEYNQRPEVKEKRKEYFKKNHIPKRTRLLTEEEEKERRRVYQKKYAKTEKRKRYNQKPEVKRKRKEYHKAYYKKDNYKEYWKKYYKENKEKLIKKGRVNKLKNKYGLTIKDYNNMLKQQGGVCAICRKKEKDKRNDKIKNLAVDHNHKTGKVRGLLCAECNKSIGYSNEDISILQKCIKYLKKHKS